MAWAINGVRFAGAFLVIVFNENRPIMIAAAAAAKMPDLGAKNEHAIQQKRIAWMKSKGVE